MRSGLLERRAESTFSFTDTDGAGAEVVAAVPLPPGRSGSAARPAQRPV